MVIMTPEGKVQKKVQKQYEDMGYYVIKLMKTNKNGIPDLIALKPNEVIFIEVKAKGGKISELQRHRIKELTNFGFQALIHEGS